MTSVAQYRQTARENVIVSSQVHGFWEFLPADYYSNPSKKYPLIIYWHGVGEVGPGTLPSMESLLVKGVDQKIESLHFPDVVYNNGVPYSYIVLTPQYMNSGLVSVADVDAMVNYAIANYRIDRNRVYLTGISLGAWLCYAYAGSSPTYAQKLAGIVPLASCAGADWGQATTIAANNIAVWGIHCQFDVQCPPSNTTGWINVINSALGHPPTPPAVYTLTEIMNTGDYHDIFWLTYEPDFVRAPTFKNIYDWMITYSRNLALPVKLASFNAYMKNEDAFVDWGLHPKRMQRNL